MSRRILVTGASVAGNTLAWWLGRYGFDVTVVERSPDFRDGGQNIDVRSAGREVLRRMDLDRVALDRGTGEKGTAWIDDEGRTVAEMVTDDLEGDGATAEMEILRGDLARLIYEPARDHAAYRFGDRIERLEDGEDGATVSFANGGTERYDAVLVAEGVGSSTRELVFPGENDPRWMDMMIGYFTIPRTADDDRMWRWYNATEGRSVNLRPDRYGTIRAMLSIQQKAHGEQDWDDDRVKAMLRDRFSDVGWQAPRVLAGLAEADDFYFDVLRQVRMERWCRGHVALTGDAAWCATPLAGIGTTLAVTGAYVLASELKRADDTASAFSAYEAAMRPMVEQGQGVPKIEARVLYPHSRIGIALLHGAVRRRRDPQGCDRDVEDPPGREPEPVRRLSACRPPRRRRVGQHSAPQGVNLSVLERIPLSRLRIRANWHGRGVGRGLLYED